MKARRRPYVIDLPALQALCSQNYHQLQQLLACQITDSELSILGQQNGKLIEIMQIRILAHARYTSLVQLAQTGQPLLSWQPATIMQVHLYHDVAMAEVIKVQHQQHFAGRYHFPNQQMRQPDEKHQLNRWLNEWLSFVLKQGYAACPAMK